MTVRIGINGFGRIGRTVLRVLEARRSTSLEDLRVVAVNDLADAATLAYLLRHDSVHGPFPAPVRTDGAHLTVDGRPVKVLGGRCPADLPWAELGVTVVVEATGRLPDADAARDHLTAGARRVVVTAPSAGADLTVVMGANDDAYDGTQTLLSAASGTTGCVALMAKVLHDAFGLVSGFVTTVHAVTGDQALHDAPHPDLRRARAAAANIVPTTTGAARAACLALPALAGRLDGIEVRVPVVDGSVTDLTAVLATPVTVAEVDHAFRRAAAAGLRGYLECTDEPLVSGDVVGSPASCTIDAGMTRVIGDRTVKVLGWHDDEWGYSHRIVDLLELVAAAPPYARQR